MRRANLTARQSAFVREYLVDFNATQAAIRAGFSVRAAGQTARDLLQHPHIYPLIQRGAKSRHDMLELRADQTMERWRRIAGVSVASLFDPVTGEPLRISELPAEVAYCLEAVEVDANGRILKAKMASKIDALKFLSKYHMLAQDVPDVPVQATTLNHTEVYLASLTTEELRVIERVLLRDQAARALPAPSTDTPPVDE
jgi:phage terminase small subunit